MESKHFSHRHNLIIHQMPEGETIDCSGCNLATSGAVYACMQCKFFLHEKCFHATRSINHPSHPLHHLTLVPYPTYPTGYFTCDSCSELGSGFSFTCSTCDFDLHVHCASISDNTPVDVVPYLESQMTGTTSTEPETEPTAAPTQIQHKSHAEHALNFLPRAPSANGTFICNGCGENGDASVYRCSTCDYDLHIKCAWLNRTVDRVDHEHPLTLYYSNPYKDKGVAFECDVCHYNVPENSWVYCCLDCDYGTHVNCVWGEERPKADTELEKFIAAKQEPTRAHTQIHHKSHAKHALNLLSRYPGADGEYMCNGCGESGNDSVYRCSTCDYDLHVKCAGLNEIVDRVDHEHPLTLFYSNPYKGKGVIFECDVCHYNIPSDSWIYCCLECAYGTHVNCVWGKERPKAVVELEKFVAAQQELSRLQQQMQMNRLSAQMIASSINGFRH
ncbi:hypothetical protein RHMOL_Rhmol07G0060000 [Rhododendron molle]|uniref:Uncharacterized protein n=1 Tax=Rhododendron molle TaxID=49168 RepID=A0ACC0MZJ8_RHOML|nr:hypothetical protein RHMOL_Rhmol07G0060000 [Rhododendron molle]